MLCLIPTAVSVTCRVGVFFLCVTTTVWFFHRDGGGWGGRRLVDGFCFVIYLFFFLQTESNNTLYHDHYVKDVRIFQYTQIKKCDTSHNKLSLFLFQLRTVGQEDPCPVLDSPSTLMMEALLDECRP